MSLWLSWLVVSALAVQGWAGQGGNNATKLHCDPLDALRELVDLSAIATATGSLHRVVASNRLHLHSSPHVDQHWDTFVKAHRKEYSGVEEQRRKRKWVENIIRIHHHNEKARLGLESYFVGVNRFADMGVREYNRKNVKLAHVGKAGKTQVETLASRKREVGIPREINWVEEGFETPPWDQADCGSCYAFTIAASAQGQYFRKTNQLINLSAQQLVDCSVAMGNRGCAGGSLRNTLRYCLHARGLVSEANYPYKAKQHGCHFHAHQRSVNVTSYVILPEGDEAAIEKAVATVGPVACSINASPHTFQLYHKGIYDDPNCSSRRVNHAMLIVGYTNDAWILKNWWGEEWGMRGYMHLRRGHNRCAVARYTGHCPTIQFRHGRTFGANTKTILDELRDISPICKERPYRCDDQHAGSIQPTAKSKDIEADARTTLAMARRPYVLGYTGYIPGLNFQYGSSFSLLADKSRLDFTSKLASEQRRRVKERMEYINTKPHLASIRGKDQVTDTLMHYTRFNQIPALPVSPELPPIAGYTGHIPGLKGNETSLSQRYHSAAQTGLTLLKEEKSKRQDLDMAKEAIRDAITYSHAH